MNLEGKEVGEGSVCVWAGWVGKLRKRREKRKKKEGDASCCLPKS